MRLKGFVLGLFTTVMASASTAWAQPSIGFVTPPDLAGPTWTGQVVGGGVLTFVLAPSGDLSGAGGSLRFAVNDNNAGAELRFNDIAWTLKLSDIGIRYTALAGGKQCEHDHVKKPKEPDQDRSLILVLDVDTDGDFVGDDMLVFDPSVNGEVECGTFQGWQATQGIWYPASNKKGAKGAAPLADYIADNPDARLIYGGIRFVAGPGLHGFVGNLDSLSLQGPPICTPDPPACVSGPAPTYFFRAVPPVFE